MALPKATAISFKHPDYPTEFNDSGFLQCETLSRLIPTDFNFPIHRMFARKNFSNEFDYDKLELSLRMSSALLTAATPIFHAILIKGASRLGTAEDGRALYSFPEPVEVLSSEEASTTLRRLEQLADGLSFQLGSEEVGANACCGRRRDADGSYKPLGPGLQGCGSTIMIGRLLYDSVARFFKGETDIIGQQASSFHCASVVIHELTHAAVNASVPTGNKHGNAQYFLGNACTTEIGFETEAWLFGGVTMCKFFQGVCAYRDLQTGKTSSLDYLITATEYPCPSKALLYKGEPDEFIIRGGQKSIEIIWQASFLMIHQLFQDDFWSEIFPHFGRRVLWFEKEVGYRFEPGENEDGLRPVLFDPGEKADLPEGHFVDRTGVIRKKVVKVEKKEVKAQGGLGFAMAKARDTAWSMVFGKR